MEGLGLVPPQRILCGKSQKGKDGGDLIRLCALCKRSEPPHHPASALLKIKIKVALRGTSQNFGADMWPTWLWMDQTLEVFRGLGWVFTFHFRCFFTIFPGVGRRVIRRSTKKAFPCGNAFFEVRGNPIPFRFQEMNPCDGQEDSHDRFGKGFSFPIR